MRWEKVGSATISDAKIVVPKGPANTNETSVDDMSVEQLAKKIRPVMETHGVEYLMNWDDTLTLAARMKSHAGPTQGEGAAPDGSSLPLDGSLEGRVSGIIDGESRTQVFSSAYPWNNNAFVSGPAGTCTAFKMINHHTAITAGHCEKDGNGNWLARGTLTFAAGTSGALAAVPAGCYDRVTVSGFKANDRDTDFAVIALHSNTANCALSTYNVGFLGWRTVSGCTTGITLNTAGYPGKNPPWGAPPPGNWTVPGLFTDYRTDNWTSCGTFPSALWFDNDFSPGMSGGPAWTFDTAANQRYVRGIQIAFDEGPFSNSNRALKMSDDVINFLSSNAGF